MVDANATLLLINEPPLQVLPTLAKQIGLNQAIVIQQIHWMLNKPKLGKVVADKKWIFNTLEDWKEEFPFWGTNTIRNVFDGLEQLGILITGCFNERPADRTKWYTINYAVLATYQRPRRKGKTDHLPKFGRVSKVRQMDLPKSGEALPETPSENNTNTNTFPNPANAVSDRPISESGIDGSAGGDASEANAITPSKSDQVNSESQSKAETQQTEERPLSKVPRKVFPSEISDLVRLVPSTHKITYSKPYAVVLAHVYRNWKTLCGVELPATGFSDAHAGGMGGVCAACAEHFHEVDWHLAPTAPFAFSDRCFVANCEREAAYGAHGHSYCHMHARIVASLPDDYDPETYIPPANPLPDSLPPQSPNVVDVRGTEWAATPADRRVYIGRTTFEHQGQGWGNPYIIGDSGTREDVILKFREHMLASPDKLRRVRDLRGKVLGCWCRDDKRSAADRAEHGYVPCHGDALAELADLPDDVLNRLIADAEAKLTQQPTARTDPEPTRRSASMMTPDEVRALPDAQPNPAPRSWKVGDWVSHRSVGTAVVIGLTKQRVKILAVNPRSGARIDDLVEQLVTPDTLTLRTWPNTRLDAEAERRIAAAGKAKGAGNGKHDPREVEMIDGFVNAMGKDRLPSGFNYGALRRNFMPGLIAEGKTKEDLACAGELFAAWMNALPGKVVLDWKRVGVAITDISRALDLCRDGVSAADVTRFVKETYATADPKTGARFWAGKLVSWEYTGTHIGIVKATWEPEQPKTKPCEACQGQGAVFSGQDAIRCETCGGSGKVQS